MLGPLDSLSISNENHLVSSTSRSSESDTMIDEETGKENYDFVNFIKTKRESKDDSTVDDLEESTTESDKVKMQVLHNETTTIEEEYQVIEASLEKK